MAFLEKQANKPLKKAAGGKSAPASDMLDDIVDKENMMEDDPVKKKTPKKKTVEETYQKLTQLEHVLLRPDTYIGSTELNRTKLWVFDEGVGLNQREVTYVPGLYKIFDEILVNAADNKQRDPNMDTMKVNIDPEQNSISVFNNGRGIPVEMHKSENCWVPELIFGHLLTSSNYNDNEKKTTGGRNGYGAKLANIFSTEFTIETADGSRSGRKYKQTFSSNMQNKGTPKIKDCGKDENWTCITFKPDLEKFKMENLDADVVAMFKKRVYDMAGCTPGVKVYLQGERLKIKNFEDYCKLYLGSAARDSETGETPKHVFLKSNDRWEVVIAVSEGQFQQVSFVNSIATTRGGSHVNHVSDQVANLFLEHLAKKHKGIKLKPFQIKNHVWVFVNCLIENPTFDSQTKETLTLKPSAFGSKVEMDAPFFKKMLGNTGIMDSILSFGQEKQNKDMKKTDGKKTGRITGIPKLEDANDAGTKNAMECTLILTEGDSAKALAVSGLAVVGRNKYGVFPLRGKVANPRDANHEQIMKNEEIKNLKIILGLQQTSKYENGPTGLRYGHVMIMADQDPDGSHIKGLLINLFHYYWPNLLSHPGFLQEFATPIVKAKKKNGKQEQAFFTLQEYEEFREQNQDSLSSWTIKYYKGLGTSSSAEAKEYFSNLPLHQMSFAWEGASDGEIIDMVFSKKRADDRKAWLLKYEEDLYVDHNVQEVSYTDFVNKELIHFSMMDNQRSIPSIVDGMKPGQRKILFACFKRKLRQEIKVAQLAGYVAEHSAYHHGEQSLAMTIINMAQNFVGTNNVNFLVPSGQFGTRLQGGADAASPRYIFTFLNKLTREIFQEKDDAILRYLDDDGQSIEPQWYMPILPTILVNGGHGIGTGWSTDIPTYNPRDIVDNVRRLMNGEVMEPMHPWFKGFTGSVDICVGKRGEVSYQIAGIVSKRNETTLDVTELPVNKWTQQYKEYLESLMETDGGKKEPFIRGYREYHTDTTVHFEIQMSEKSMREAEEIGIHKKFQLTKTLSTTNMHLFNSAGQIQKYDSPEEILREFYGLRLDFYGKRKAYMVSEMSKQLSVLDNKVRFIKEVIAGTLKISNRKKSDIVEELTKKGYNAMSNKELKKKVEDEEAEEDEASVGKRNYDYLLTMPILSLTLERVNSLQSERDAKAEELDILQSKTPEMLWNEDLDSFMENYDKFELDEQAIHKNELKVKHVKGAKKKANGTKRKNSWASDESEDFDNDESEDDFMPKKKGAAKKAPKAMAAPSRPNIEINAIPPPKPVAPVRSAAPAAKKQDVKTTPDKAAMVPSPPPPQDSDDEGPTLSLFDRLNFKMGSSTAPGPAKKPAQTAAAAVKKAAPKKKKVESESEEESEEESDAEFKPKKKVAAKPAAKAPAKKKASKKKDSDDDEEDFEEAVRAMMGDDDIATDRSAKPRRAAAAKKPIVISDDDEEEDDYEPSPVMKKTAKRPAAKKALDSDEDEDTEEVAPKAKAAPRAKAAPAKTYISERDEDEEEQDDGDSDDYQPKKKEVKRRPTYASKPKAAAPRDDFDFEDEVAAPPKKTKPAAAAKPKAPAKEKAPAKKAPAKKKQDSDDDSDGFAGDAMAARDPKDDTNANGRPARRAAVVKKTKYTYDDEDSEVSLEDEDSDDDFE